MTSPPSPGGKDGARLILVGRAAGAFGVKGEVRLHAYTADPLALLEYRDLKRADGASALTLVAGRRASPTPGDAGLIVRAREVETREAAQALRGLELYVARDALPPPGDADDFYLADLIGLAVRDPEGRALGRVKAVHDFGAGDILEIAEEARGGARLVAFTRENVPEVDLAAGLLVVRPPTEVDGDAPQPKAPRSGDADDDPAGAD